MDCGAISGRAGERTRWRRRVVKVANDFNALGADDCNRATTKRPTFRRPAAPLV
jgi:hypothetical protein